MLNKPNFVLKIDITAYCDILKVSKKNCIVFLSFAVCYFFSWIYYFKVGKFEITCLKFKSRMIFLRPLKSLKQQRPKSKLQGKVYGILL